ncbi:DegT/DnrJ/EryC1/StrS family aminotransferase [Marivirga harenae]|uniref:DegT/DnrJ/EryC1/StrS family aminotransferase n=1 Tax=Marivirga harenae TaxID=2010992 RepID=UPI0026DED257|nr:DegT/DnrJ/EryC1/StrS family aminotransferase [Marivirga harenae]WKV11790.1 DegT/DnrJ/EryC1/StrS family aminotransferase [Marivirga harenae]
MPVKSIPFLKLSPVRKEIRSAIDNVLNEGVFMNGKYLNKFCKDFSNYLGQDYLIPTANCTDALEIILRSIEIQEGDEVITSAFSWFSDASVIKLVGGKIVFCDIYLDHFGIQLSELEEKISPKTKALILPHLFGLVHPEIEKIVSICKKNEIYLIEDCAQAHGASLNGKLAGTFGDIAAFSFYPTKNLGALGDAGAILTSNEDLAEKCKLWANHGQSGRNSHIQMGRNSRMDEIQAAVLSAQLPFLDADNIKRRKIAELYFTHLQGLALPLNCSGHFYHQFVIRTNRRDALQDYLMQKKIETDIHYPTALSEMSVFKVNMQYPSAIEASKSVLSLPIHPSHSEEDIQFVIQNINSFFKS